MKNLQFSTGLTIPAEGSGETVAPKSGISLSVVRREAEQRKDQLLDMRIQRAIEALMAKKHKASLDFIYWQMQGDVLSIQAKSPFSHRKVRDRLQAMKGAGKVKYMGQRHGWIITNGQE